MCFIPSELLIEKFDVKCLTGYLYIWDFFGKNNDKKTKKILGAGIAGENAGELISESVLGLEMGANIEDVALTVHPHPTLSETTFFASEIADGTITDLYIPKK